MPRGATYSSIQSAVDVASAGDTIQVCAGIYTTVNVDKQLTFLGAKAGQDGRTGRNHPGLESIVSSPAGDFIIGAGVSDVTIDGFTLQGAVGDTGTSNAIEAFHGGSGFTFSNNVIKDNQQGITMSNPDPAQPTEITQNAFIQQQRRHERDRRHRHLHLLRPGEQHDHRKQLVHASSGDGDQLRGRLQQLLAGPRGRRQHQQERLDVRGRH